MCGIAGYFTLNASIDQYKGDVFLKKASEALFHRGPDGYGIWKNEQVGLLHRRLNIMDFSETGHQPLSHSGFHLIFNGEIYNYLDLAKKYGFPGIPPNDTCVLHHVFRVKGMESLAELDGMFAGAIYDENSKSLSLFRDKNGIKPLIYYWNGHALVFASEMKAVLEWGFERKLRSQALSQYLFYEFIPGKDTIFENVHKVLPAQFLTVNKSGLRITNFTNILPEPSLHPQSAFSDAFEASVHSQLSASVPIGAFFSGGADSTAVVWKATEASSVKNLDTFTVTFDQPDFDESRYAQDIGALLPVTTHFHRVNSKEVKLWVERLADIYDEPFAVPSVIPTLELCRVASQHLRVALCGDGGDERLLGYGAYLLAKKIMPYHSLFPIIHPFLSWRKNLRYERASRYFSHTSGANRLAHFWSQSQDMFSLSEIKALLVSFPTDAKEHINLFWDEIENIANPIDTYFKSNSKGEHALRRLNLFDQLFYFPSDLMYKTDMASMAHSLEVRVPFMSNHLNEWNIAIHPLKDFLYQDELKYPLKKMLLKRFPEHLILRPKWGFPAPMGKWLQADLAFLIDKYLNPDTIKQQGIFQPAIVSELIRSFKQGKIFHYKRLWTLISFQMWYNKYIHCS